MTLPQTQTAAVLPQAGASPNAQLEIKHDHPVPVPGKGDFLVKLEYSGVCHSDVHSIRGDTPMLTEVAGHEGVGRVVSVGTDISEECIGMRVGIRWLYSSCLDCEICALNHAVCPYQRNAGANVPGTFQQYIVSPAVHVTKLPEELSPEIAAPLLCAGIAMYSSIMKTKTKPGDWIALFGAGGGLGHLGIQIAAKKGLKVIAIDSGKEKKQLCLSSGTRHFFDYKVDNVDQEIKSITSGFGAHAAICTANSDAAYLLSMRVLRPLGVLVCVGIPSLPFRLPATPLDMIQKGLTIVGNSAGTAGEMHELMKMAVAGDVRPHIECLDFKQINEVLQKLGRFEINGRVVVKIPD